VRTAGGLSTGEAFTNETKPYADEWPGANVCPGMVGRDREATKESFIDRVRDRT